MKIGTTVLMASLLVTGAAGLAQTKAQPKPTKAVKESGEASFARQNLDQVLNAVNTTWFGPAYKGIRSVDMDGTLVVNFSAAAANAKVEQLGQGAVKGGLTKGGTVNMRLQGTYFANADFKNVLTGDFGTITYQRMGPKGFIYSKDMNAYTTKVDPPPSDAPDSFLGWFSQCVNEIRDVYVKGSMFKAALGREEGNNQIITFTSPTGPYDPKKREQSMAESLGFWKRGKLEVAFDKASHLPQHMEYRNEGQGVASRMTFNYTNGNRIGSVTLENQSKGMEGPASLTLNYDDAGRISRLDGTMNFPVGTLRFDLGLTWAGDKKSSSVATIPPMGATKKGGEELQTMLLVNLAGKVLDLQRGGFNLRSVTLSNK